MDTTKAPDLWEFLEQEAPHAEHTKHLFQWSLNYDHGQRPFDLFLDLIGYSEEQYGTNLHSGDYGSTIGYVEADYLADALKEWADHPQRVEAWVSSLMECEG